MNPAVKNEQTYLDILRQLVEKDTVREDRTGTGTTSIFGVQARYDISEGRIPVLSTKKIYLRSIIHELIWMFSGEKSIKYLKDNNVSIWDSWLVPGTEVTDEDGNLLDGISSSIYGESWRGWEDTRVLSLDQLGDIPEISGEGRPMEKFQILHQSGGNVVVTRDIDQINRVMWQIRNKPTSRRIILNGWNVARVDDVTLPPCHVMAQFYVENGTLSCQMYQRSADYFAGAAFNIVQYALLTHIFAKCAGLKTGELIHVIGDCHLYSNHRDAAVEQLSRELIEENDPRVSIQLADGDDPTAVSFDDVIITGYQHHSAIPVTIAV